MVGVVKASCGEGGGLGCCGVVVVEEDGGEWVEQCVEMKVRRREVRARLEVCVGEEAGWSEVKMEMRRRWRQDGDDQ